MASHSGDCLYSGPSFRDDDIIEIVDDFSGLQSLHAKQLGAKMNQRRPQCAGPARKLTEAKKEPGFSMSWQALFCGRDSCCMSPAVAPVPLVECQDSNLEARVLVEMFSEVPEASLPHQFEQLLSKEVAKEVAVDGLTTVPADLYMTLLDAGKRAKRRGGHRLEKRITISKNKFHLVQDSKVGNVHP